MAWAGLSLPEPTVAADRTNGSTSKLQWTAAETIVRVNGLPVVRGIKQDGLTHGRAGLITRQTTAKFDRLLVTRTYGDPEFRESFSAGAPSWNVIKGNWSVVNGVYQNSAVQHGSITLLPIFVGIDSLRVQTQSFEVHARMLNPYGASGNRMGFVYNYSTAAGDGSYEEIVFGADGIARVNHVRDLGRARRHDKRDRDTARDGALSVGTEPVVRRQVHGACLVFARDGRGIHVSVNGTPVFTNLDSGAPQRAYRIGHELDTWPLRRRVVQPWLQGILADRDV